MTFVQRFATIALLVLFSSTLASKENSTTKNSGPIVASCPLQQLASLDTREAVPLLPMMALHQKENMRDHLVVIQEIVGALATGDFDAVQQSAARISFSPQAAQMCTHMGAGAPGFTEMGMSFHETADSIVEAAKRNDMSETLEALNDTIKACTACHTRFRQEVVTEQQWQNLTGVLVPPHTR